MTKKPTFEELEQRVKELEKGSRKLEQAEKALRESDEKFKALVEQSLQGIIIAQGIPPRIVFANPTIADILGYSIEKLLSLPAEGTKTLVHPDEQEAFFRHYQDRLSGKPAPPYYEVRAVRKDGEILWLEMFAQSIVYQGKSAVQAAFVDITRRKRTERALKKSEERFRRIIEKTKAGYFFIDRNGRFQDVNEAWLQMHGYASPKEVMGKDFSMTLVEEDLEKAKINVERLLQGEAIITGEASRKRRDGSVGYHLFSANPVTRGEEILGIEGFLIDSTELKMVQEGLQRSEEKYRTVADFAYDWEYWIDTDGSFKYVSPSCDQVTGYRPDEFLDDPNLLVKITHPEDRPMIEENICHKIETGVVHNFDFRIITRNGEERWINHICQPVWSEDQHHRGRRACNRDITSRKLMAEALTTSEERIRALNKEILNMLMVVSHDIRSPLLSMAATLKLLHKGVYGKTGESVRNTLNDLYARVNRLLGTAEDCLGKTSSVVKGDFEMERKVLDLREDIIDPILEEFSLEIGEQDITIDNRLGAIPADRIPIKANMVWLRIVFRNLFSNAIKYGGTGCTIAFGFEDHGSHYQCNVYNSGPPIPKDRRDKLFKRFSRIGVAGGKEEKGMGLGLYLVEEIMQKHGGDIWYEAEEDGSNFVFTLPRE